MLIVSMCRHRCRRPRNRRSARRWEREQLIKSWRISIEADMLKSTGTLNLITVTTLSHNTQVNTPCQPLVLRHHLSQQQMRLRRPGTTRMVTTLSRLVTASESTTSVCSSHHRCCDGILKASPVSDRIVRLLGQGTFGKVIEATEAHKTRRVAIKIIRAIPKYREASTIEIRVLKKLREQDANGNL